MYRYTTFTLNIGTVQHLTILALKFGQKKIIPSRVIWYTLHCLSVRPSVHTSFTDNSPYSFHWIALKLGGQLDHEVLRRILFEVTVYQISIVIMLFNYFLDMTLFPDNSSCSFHLNGLKHGGQLDYEVMRCILILRLGYTKFWWSYSSLNIVQAWYHFQLTPPIVFIWSSCYLYVVG